MNPKDLVGAKKAPTRYVPQALVLETAAVMATGAAKYGPFNWRQQPVSAITYAEAIQRHLSAWAEGQDVAEDSGLNHIAHIAASCGILLDAAANGTLLDDRIEGPAAAILRRLDRSASTEPYVDSRDAVIPAPSGEVAPEVGTVFMCGHTWGQEPSGCDPQVHWSRVNGVEMLPLFAFRQVGTEDVPAGVAVCEDAGHHIPGLHLLECPEFDS